MRRLDAFDPKLNLRRAPGRRLRSGFERARGRRGDSLLEALGTAGDVTDRGAPPIGTSCGWFTSVNDCCGCK